MLAPLIDPTQKITLIQDSGIQFLDIAIKAGHSGNTGNFVRKTANGPLLLLDQDVHSGKFLLDMPNGVPEVVKPEFSFTLQQSLTLLEDTWLPLPILRIASPRHVIGGPDNWARLRLVALDNPDAAGNTHRACLAFDTKAWPADHEMSVLALSENDAKNGVNFSLAWHNNELAEFLDLTWIDGWLREIFTQQASQHETRSSSALKMALKTFEYQAHYLNILSLIGRQCRLDDIKIHTATPQRPMIPVDFILDPGNSHTCGILVEDHPDESNGLLQSSELHLRDLERPQYVYTDMFESRVEFSQAIWGKQNFSVESGHEAAFTWPSIVRVGHEANRLAMQRSGTEGATGISSPRRYLWDEACYLPGWHFNPGDKQTAAEPLAIAAPLTLLVNDLGQPLFTLPIEERLPAFSPHFSRSSLMTFMLCELLAQALMQINSVAHRLRMPHSSAPRYLRTIILTLPTAMPKPEREIFRRRMQEAIGLVWKAMAWHPTDAPFAREQDRAAGTKPAPQVQMEWDEATCGQMVYLFNETQVNFGGRADDFFASMARPDRIDIADKPAGKTLCIASIDIGGGTTDLAITRYALDNGNGNNVKITPHLLFREGFNVAGDDILLDVIQLYVLPALQNELKISGLAQPDALMDKLFGYAGRVDAHSALRQQAVLQIFMPIAQALLGHYENLDPLDSHAEIDVTFGELLHPPTTQVLHYINSEIHRELGNDTFDILDVPLVVAFSQFHAQFLTERLSVTTALRAMAEVVAFYACDVLLLTGRPSRFPGIQALFRHLQPLPANRIFSLEGYHTSDWYPFNKQGRIDNPKSTAAVGAMLCLLALDLRLASFYFKAGDFQPWSTIRYLGMLDANQRLTAENVYYRDIHLDQPGFILAPSVRFQVRGNLCLGFRQLENDCWPASPLYSLTIVDAQLARKLAGDGVLYVRLGVVPGHDPLSAECFTIADAHLADGSSVPRQHLRLSLNTLSVSGNSTEQYWIDSGSVFKK
nr:virulence factor SrfB [Pantoea sp. 201603H]